MPACLPSCLINGSKTRTTGIGRGSAAIPRRVDVDVHIIRFGLSASPCFSCAGGEAPWCMLIKHGLPLYGTRWCCRQYYLAVSQHLARLIALTLQRCIPHHLRHRAIADCHTSSVTRSPYLFISSHLRCLGFFGSLRSCSPRFLSGL